MESQIQNQNKEKIYNIIRIAPVKGVKERLPKRFVSQVKQKGKIQDREFVLKIIPLVYKEYVLYNTNRYNTQVIIEIMNGHVEPIDVSYEYILKWPMLVKSIIDLLFEISGRTIEKVNQDPKVLFQELRKKRDQYQSFTSLLDRMVFSVGGFEAWYKFSELETLEERLLFAAAFEVESDVIIEDRWDAQKIYKKGLNLKPDKEFRKYYNKDKDAETSEAIDAATQALTEKMKRDKKLADMGIKIKVDTTTENKDLSQF